MSDMSSLRLLIAEDEPTVAAALSDELTQMGHRVVGLAVNGAEAVALARDLRPEIVLMDIKMPDMDGLTAAGKIWAGDRIPTVILSAYATVDLITAAEDAGVFAYLLKPAAGDQIRAALDIAYRRCEDTADLRREVSDLRVALESRKLIERAKGILMDRLRFSEAEAYRRLQKQARDQNRKLADVAAAVISAEQTMFPAPAKGPTSPKR